METIDIDKMQGRDLPDRYRSLLKLFYSQNWNVTPIQLVELRFSISTIVNMDSLDKIPSSLLKSVKNVLSLAPFSEDEISLLTQNWPRQGVLSFLSDDYFFEFLSQISRSREEILAYN